MEASRAAAACREEVEEKEGPKVRPGSPCRRLSWAEGVTGFHFTSSASRGG